MLREVYLTTNVSHNNYQGDIEITKYLAYFLTVVMFQLIFPLLYEIIISALLTL